MIQCVISIQMCGFCSPVCQEGLVLGESRVDEQVTISDSQSDHIHIEEVYSKFPSLCVL